jgi:hypothetical protein
VTLVRCGEKPLSSQQGSFYEEALRTYYWQLAPVFLHCCTQRVMSDIQRARLSRGRIFWLLAHPPRVSKLDRRHTGRLRKKDNLQTCRRGERRGWARRAELYDHKNHGPLQIIQYSPSVPTYCVMFCLLIQYIVIVRMHRSI